MESKKAPFQLPPLEEIKSVSPLPGETLEALKHFVSQHNQATIKLLHIPPDSVDQMFTLLQEMTLEKKKWKPLWKLYLDESSMKLLHSFLVHPHLRLIHVIRFAMLTDFFHSYYNNGWYLNIEEEFEELLLFYRNSHEKTFGLRKIAAVFKVIGIDADTVGWSCIGEEWRKKPFFMWDADSLWPFFFENRHILKQIFDFQPPSRRIYSFERSSLRKKGFMILSQFRVIPRSFHNFLLMTALGMAKTERPIAQQCLEKLPNKEERIIEALKSGKQEERAAAAQWAGNLNIPQFIPHLKSALKKEKSDLAKGEMIEALETLGVPVEEFLDRSSMKENAAKALKKGIPQPLSWFPFAGLPVVHWQDTGETVEPDILKWLLLLAFKLKSPEPGALLRKYCYYMKPEERALFGKYILEAWIARDTLPLYTYEQAAPEAQRQARQLAQWYPGKKPEDFYQQCLNQLLKECKGSAIKEKGILALAAACCDDNAAAPVQEYLKQYYGLRAAQSRALIQMLGWVSHPIAIQFLLSVANRFRTKSIQEQAEKSVKQLAERQGWTIDELADRTIPTGGFDKTGKMELDYGPRIFTCHLDENFKISVINESGKVIQSLPEAAKADDPDKVTAAKYDLSQAKKTVKSVLKLQKDRLYESMCTQRQWNYRDLKDYLFTHPIVSRYCQQLIWARVGNGTATITFRPLEDGSLTDHQDNEVTLEDSAKIWLAHSCNTDEKTAAAWLTHFQDYNISPLFTQFREEVFRLKPGEKNLKEVIGFRGYMLDSFKLRGMAKKLAYSRGQAEDGGYFYEYTKRFAGLGIKAVIEFSGSRLPEEIKRVALIGLHFLAISKEPGYDSYQSGPKLALDRVPEVLLSETWNDMKQIALSGSGYDEDWKQKVEY